MDVIIKIAIIHGEEKLDGQIDYITCNLENEKIHIAMMLDYLKTHYLEDNFLQSSNIYTSINSIALYLCRKGNAIFLNTTSYNKEMLMKHGRNGILIMPQNITENQKESLQELKEKISKINELQVWYDIQEDNNAKVVFGNVDVIDNFICKTK